ncbi:HAMP domain-containing sensor histidine kinase [Nocardioides sp. 1609]|uniref:HAMP domain-containing sensor histidine kinase n=1 Tax=Nocardioides sp. 1609 TaxID=2508327 RepID=UPI00106FD500|nr:HAMP domain-containing sensor histidine kinase [Nocardioides sp. 1609]
MPDRARDAVRLRHSLVLRLFALVTVVAVVAVALTAWLTVRTTTAGLREEQGDAVAAGARIEDALVEHAATHPDWSEVGPLVDRLAAGTGNRVTLVDDTGRVLADSSDATTAPPDGPSTTIDPLDVGPTEAPDPAAGAVGQCPDAEVCPVAEDAYAGPRPGAAPIAPQAVGPFALDEADRRTSQARAARAAECLGLSDPAAAVVVTASGRAVVDGAPRTGSDRCGLRALVTPFASERAPLERVQVLLDRCLERLDGPAVSLLPDLSWVPDAPRTAATERVVASCLTTARRQVLAPYVAPPARLHVSSTRQEPTTFLDLSTRNRWRIGGVVALVLLLGLGFAALAGRQLVRPLALLATAAGRVREGDLGARAAVRSHDEIGRVAEAFNTMAERREEAERLRKAMVGDVAHELRNPISTMRGTLEAAQDGLVPVDGALVASLMEETLMLQHVVEDLRDLAAADAGDLRLVAAAVRVSDLLGHVAAAHLATARSRGVVLVVEAEDDLHVVGDVLRLRQVVGNLASNAVRHSAEGGVVELHGRRRGATAEIEVRDHGEGIAPADLAHVFDRFWRADPSRTRASGGSGLGLAIVRQLVEAHGGTVTAHSTPGDGARFVVRLPLG